ncbi:MAG: carbohydrate kinase family protein [Thermomicrobiales bacterium]|nr:carbohydrate kinase family protein [Thermomicrobiales bacterium]
MSRAKPRINCIGLSSWDRLIAVPAYPEVGGQADVLVEVSAPGGTTTNTAVALARLGADVGLATAIGDDDRGKLVRAGLEAEGIDTSWVTVKPGEVTDLATVIVSREPLDRTIFWEQGAQLRRHDRLDILGLMGGDLLVIDVGDAPLRRFLLDLPAHTVPTAQLLGSLTYLANEQLEDAFEMALRHDAIVSNVRDLLDVTGTWTLSDATTALQHRMRGENLRAALITLGAEGCHIVTEAERRRVPAYKVNVVDPTGAGDAFVAGAAWGMAQRWEWDEVARFANAVGALSCCSLGAQSSLPSLEDVRTLMRDAPLVID